MHPRALTKLACRRPPGAFATGRGEICGVVIKFTPSEPGVFRVINFTVTMIIDGQTYQEQISFKALAVEP